MSSQFFNALMKIIQDEIQSIKETAKEKQLSTRKEIVDLFSGSIKKSIAKSFFKNNTIAVSNKVFTLVYLDKRLYLKPHKYQVGLELDLSAAKPVLDEIIHSAIKKTKTKMRFGNKSFSDSDAISVIGKAVEEYAPDAIGKYHIFQINK